MKAFHATSLKNANLIRKNGLLPLSFLANTHKAAKRFGTMGRRKCVVLEFEESKEVFFSGDYLQNKIKIFPKNS